MSGSETWRQVADQLDREAARLEEECALASTVLPEPDCTADVLEQVTRSQWRDAGLARSLRDAASELRDAGRLSDATARLFSTSRLRVQSWLLARQVEYDAAADLAMTELARCRDERTRRRVVARSAYAIGRARGMRLASDIWNVATRVESPVAPGR